MLGVFSTYDAALGCCLVWVSVFSFHNFPRLLPVYLTDLEISNRLYTSLYQHQTYVWPFGGKPPLCWYWLVYSPDLPTLPCLSEELWVGSCIGDNIWGVRGWVYRWRDGMTSLPVTSQLVTRPARRPITGEFGRWRHSGCCYRIGPQPGLHHW